MEWDKLFKGAVAGASAAASYLIGGLGVMFFVLVGLAVLDVITGVTAAAVEARLGKSSGLSSAHGHARAPRKVMMFCMVALGALADLLLQHSGLPSSITIAGVKLGSANAARDAITLYYCVFEFISNIENAGRARLPLPRWLKQLVSVLRSASGHEEGKSA